jgi:DNA-binding transcriptional MerR regulator
MPKTVVYLNAFTAAEVREITGLSMPMINYLRRENFLKPAYETSPGRQGRVRYYSYRDLVVARLIQKLRDAGVRLLKIKEAVEQLRRDDLWAETPERLPSTLAWLKTDGRDVFVERTENCLQLMRPDRQGAFGFLVDVGGLASEVKSKIPPGDRLLNFSMQNRDLVRADTRTASPRQRGSSRQA